MILNNAVGFFWGNCFLGTTYTQFGLTVFPSKKSIEPIKFTKI